VETKDIDSFLQEEERCDYLVTSERKQHWAVLLDLISKLQEVCEKHKLTYYLAGGSLLGAIRHQGFIPWDDDADILMPREDFERLKKLASKEFTEPYYFQTEETNPDTYLGGIARLINTRTTNMNHWHPKRQFYYAMWIDISVLDNLHEAPRKRKKQIHAVRRYQRMLYAKLYPEYKLLADVSFIKWAWYKFAARWLSHERIVRKINEAMTDCQDSKYVTCFTYHVDSYFPPLMEKEIFSDRVLVSFEWLKVHAPIGYDQYLTIKYGEYMRLPPKEIRRTRHVGQLISADIPYRSFLFDFELAAEDLTGKTIVIFGAGQMFEHYMEHQGHRFPPAFIVDNNPAKWSTNVHGIPVKSPEELLTVPSDQLRLIICNIYFREIAKQLRQMNIHDFYIYVQEKQWLF